MSKSHLLLAVAAITFPLTLAFARAPGRDVGHRHPNLDQAQDLTFKAFAKIEAAQRANEFDLGGHAKRAKEALVVASEEMKLAAQFANQH